MNVAHDRGGGVSPLGVQVRGAVERLAFPHEEWAAQIDTMASYFEATRVALPTIDLDRIGELVAAAETERALVARLTDELVFRHADPWKLTS